MAGVVGEDPLDSPGAGPSRISRDNEDADRQACELDADFAKAVLRRRKDYLELEKSVQASDELLASLASYLSTFQNDLSTVSGQVSDLQQRSSDIDAQLKGRRTILPSLNALLGDITLPPALVLTLRDTQPSANPDLWLSAIEQLEEKISAVKTRGKVKAAHEMESIIEGLRVKALTQLPPFLLSLIRPLRSSSTGLSTNLAVLQTSLLLKYQPFYAFVFRQNPKVAKQVERGYVSAARAYYETGMRRYARALGVIRSRTTEKSELIGVVATDATLDVMEKRQPGVQEAYERLEYARLDMEGPESQITLAYMTDNKDLRLPIEALFRSLSMVLLDNASAEFTFIVRFFARSLHASPTPAPSRSETPSETPSTPRMETMSEAGRPRSGMGQRRTNAEMVVAMKEAERIFHEVFDPALEYYNSFCSSMLSPSPPPAVPLLTMIRLNDRALGVCELRGTNPLTNILQAQKMAMWPIFRKEMDAHIDSLKRLADDAEGKGFAGLMGKRVKDGTVRQVGNRYAALFSCMVALNDESEEAMIFSSMTRLRAELVRLTQLQAKKLKSPTDQHSFLSSIYEVIMHELVSGPGQTTAPRLQSELSFFRTREEEARRRISA